MSIRNATEADLDVITWVAVNALLTDKVTDYRTPHARQYPEDFRKFWYARNAAFLADPGVKTMVYEAPSIENPQVKKVVAYSAWWLPDYQAPDQSAKKPEETENLHRDMNPARMQAFTKAYYKAKKDFFESRYGTSYFYLGYTACHPDYWRRGAGQTLLLWGLREAQEKDWPITLFASTLGIHLYRKVGFREVGRFRAQVEGEEEYVEIPAMVFGGQTKQ